MLSIQFISKEYAAKQQLLEYLHLIIFLFQIAGDTLLNGPAEDDTSSGDESSESDSEDDRIIEEESETTENLAIEEQLEKNETESVEATDNIQESEQQQEATEDASAVDEKPDTVDHRDEIDDSITPEQMNEVQRRLDELYQEDGSDDSDQEYNKTYKPFRNEGSRAHVNTHRTRVCSTSSMGSTASSINFDPTLVKQKVASQLKQQRMKQYARRVRKHGESALNTTARREVSYDVKSSMDAVWY